VRIVLEGIPHLVSRLTCEIKAPRDSALIWINVDEEFFASMERRIRLLGDNLLRLTSECVDALAFTDRYRRSQNRKLKWEIYLSLTGKAARLI
jgi:hypothetical protein